MKVYFKIVIFCYAFILITFPAKAQYNIPANFNWIFSNSGVSFNNDTIIPITPSQPTNIGMEEGGAAVSDEQGNLLFYSNASDVWSSNDVLMPHSSYLILNNQATSTATQSTLIVPSPTSNFQYYLFTLGVDSMNFYSRLYVYLIDMSLNNGLGDVDTSFYLTNQLFADSLTEKMIAIQGCDRSVWVVTKSLDNGKFYSYKIDMNGLDINPVISVAGNQPPEDYRVGALVASPNGQLMAVTSFNVLEIMYFDGTNGKVSFKSNISGALARYGVAFSPSGRFLYSMSGYIYQHDLLACSIENSSYYLGNYPVNSHLALAPNGKIYYRSKTAINMQVPYFYLGSIEAPDSAGVSSHHRDSVTEAKIYTSLSSIFSTSLQNTVIDPKENSFKINRRYFDTCICKVNKNTGFLLKAADGFNNYLWNDGSTNPQLSVMTGGTYWVKYPTLCGERTDTFHVRTQIDSIQLLFDGVSISCQGGYDFYQWQLNGNVINNAHDSFLTVGDDGLYTLIAGVGNNCKDTAYLQINTSNIQENENNHVKIYPNPTQDELFIISDLDLLFKVYDMNGRELLNGHQSVISLNSLANGMYFLFLFDEKGNCIKREKVLKRNEK